MKKRLEIPFGHTTPISLYSWRRILRKLDIHADFGYDYLRERHRFAVEIQNPLVRVVPDSCVRTLRAGSCAALC